MAATTMPAMAPGESAARFDGGAGAPSVGVDSEGEVGRWEDSAGKGSPGLSW